MHFSRVLVGVLRHWLGRWTLHFRSALAFNLGGENLLPAIHTRDLVDAVRQAEIAALSVLDDVHLYEGMMRAAVAGVTLGMAHSN